MSKILIIDDDNDFRDALATYFELEGYEVATAFDGEDGLHQFEKQQPDVVVCDLVMPNKDGLETMTELVREKGFNNIVAVSGGSRSISKNHLMAARVLGINTLSKPFEFEELEALIKPE